MNSGIVQPRPTAYGGVVAIVLTATMDRAAGRGILDVDDGKFSVARLSVPGPVTQGIRVPHTLETISTARTEETPAYLRPAVDCTY